MAESHSEDSPLLGATDPPSPGECSPAPRGLVPSWSSHFHPLPHEEEENATPTWTPEVGRRASAERLHVPRRTGVKLPGGGDPGVKTNGGSSQGVKATPRVKTPKFVHSQTSMDSGCDCDISDVGADSPPQAANRAKRNPGEGFSPLSPSQPVASEPPSPGPSGCVAPLAQKESLDCQCGGLDQQCVCDISGHPVSLKGSGEEDPLSPADRGVLAPVKVTFCIEGYEDDDELHHPRLGYTSSNGMESSSQSGSEPGEDFRDLVKGATMTFPRVTSYPKPGMLSSSSSTASMPMCRICHFPQGEDPDTLISPCRCSGTMQFIHESCLMKWLDVSKSKKTATCELCNYQYNRHKKFRFRHWELPSCSRIDKILHVVFLLCLVVMVTCATITIYCFKQDRFIKNRENTDLTKSEVVTLTCGVLFFVAFFMAMYVEVKAKDTLYRLFSRFVHLNQTWHIDEYDKQRDNQHAPV